MKQEKVYRVTVQKDAYAKVVLMAMLQETSPRKLIESMIEGAWESADTNSLAEPEQGIYFLHNTRTDMVKIGMSANVGERIKYLQHMNSEELIPIGFIRVANHSELRAKEQEIHKRFKESRTHGEWFYASSEMLEWIKTNNNTVL